MQSLLPRETNPRFLSLLAEPAAPVPEPESAEPPPGAAGDVASLQAQVATAAEPGPPLSVGSAIHGQATFYGPAYNGQVLGCGTGVYSSDNEAIMAVGPARYDEWPCGTQVRVCGPAGCVVATRHDACPGCYANLVDLSEAGNRRVCGSPPHTCAVTLEVVIP